MEKTSGFQYSPIAFISFNHTGTHDSANTMLKTALISVTCLYVMTSALIFIIGFLCGHCFSQRHRKSEKQSVSNSTNVTCTEHAEDLELKENVAYVTVRPK